MSNDGPSNAEGLVFRNWKQENEMGHICQDGHYIPSKDEVREFIREEVARQLQESSGGIVGVREYIRLAGKAHNGRSVRGMLYFEDDNSTDPEVPAVQDHEEQMIPSGICWACGRYGASAAMMWYNPARYLGQRSHLIHATAECIKLAQLKPEVTEHRDDAK